MRIHSFFSALICVQFVYQVLSEDYVHVYIPEVLNSDTCILPRHITLVLESVHDGAAFNNNKPVVFNRRNGSQKPHNNIVLKYQNVPKYTESKVRHKEKETKLRNLQSGDESSKNIHKTKLKASDFYENKSNVFKQSVVECFKEQILKYKVFLHPNSAHGYNGKRGRSRKGIIHIRLIKNRDVDVNVPVYVIKTDKLSRLHASFIKDYANYHSGTSYFSLQCNQNGTNISYQTTGSVYIGNIKYNLEIADDVRGGLTREKTLFKLVPDIEHYTDHKSDYQKLQAKKSNKIQEYKASRRRKRSTIKEIFLDVLVVTDYAIYNEWMLRENGITNKVKDNIRRYFAHIINGVSARYKSIESTLKIDIRLIGIIIADSPETAPWTELHKEKVETRYQVDADIVLEALKQWVNNSTDIPPHDHVMLFTGYDLFGNDNGFRFNYTTGLAYIGTMCQGDGRSVSIVEDHGGFQSVGTATHEIGHSLGADHDGTNNTCSSKNRYIMAGQSFNETTNNAFNPWTFSRCSIKYFTDYINSISDSIKQRQCLINKIVVDVTLPDVDDDKPGQEYTPDQQCTNIYGNTSYLCRGTSFGDGESICKAMFCRNPHTSRKCVLHSAAEGTSCGDRKWCNQGHCVYCKQAPARQAGCIFGDQAGVIFEGKTCDMLLKESPGYCYIQSFWDRCCQSCYSLHTGIKGCEFGDKVLHCKEPNCGQIVSNGTLYDIDCCGTCSYKDHQTITLTPHTTTVTVSKTCEDTDIDNITCSNYLQLNGKLECYTEQVYEKCCQSCSKIRSHDDDCEYGDRIMDCNKDECERTFDYSQPSYSVQCCETCQSDQSDDNKVDNECHDKGTVNHLSCAVFLDKYGKSKCYIPDVFDNCCETCSQLQLHVPTCNFGDRDPRVCEEYITTTNECDERYETLCCESCELLEREEQVSNQQESLGYYLEVHTLLLGLMAVNIINVILHGFI